MNKWRVTHMNDVPFIWMHDVSLIRYTEWRHREWNPRNPWIYQKMHGITVINNSDHHCDPVHLFSKNVVSSWFPMVNHCDSMHFCVYYMCSLRPLWCFIVFSCIFSCGASFIPSGVSLWCGAFSSASTHTARYQPHPAHCTHCHTANTPPAPRSLHSKNVFDVLRNWKLCWQNMFCIESQGIHSPHTL